MKNIQKQYTDLLEGKMSKANFMRNVRMQFPQYVSPVTSYDDSIKILKGKRILSEAKQPEGVYGHNPSAEVTKYPNFDTVNYNQLMKGMKYELSLMGEITDENLVLAKEKALKALTKDPMAYRELMIANQKAITEMDKDLKMKDVKEDNKVDKANGMKVVKKDAEASANKSAKFTQKVEKVIQMTQTPKKAKGIEKVMEVPGKEKVVALKEAILKEFDSYKNEIPENFSKGQRVMTKDKKKVGEVTDVEQDTATVKLDDGTLEHIQLNVLTAKDVPAKEEKVEESKSDAPHSVKFDQGIDKSELEFLKKAFATTPVDQIPEKYKKIMQDLETRIQGREEKVEETIIKADQWNTHNYPGKEEWDAMSEEERFKKMMDSAAAKYGEKQLRIRAKDDYDTLTKYNPRVKQAMAFPKSPLTVDDDAPAKEFPIKGDIGAAGEKFKKSLKEKMKKALEELLYKNKKTGQIQSFDTSHPEDKSIMSDPQFNQVFTKA